MGQGEKEGKEKEGMEAESGHWGWRAWNHGGEASPSAFCVGGGLRGTGFPSSAPAAGYPEAGEG